MKVMLICYDDEPFWEKAGQATLMAAMQEAVGIFSGAVTNTPSLAAAGEALRGKGLTATSTVAGYAIAYPFGIMGIIIAMVVNWFLQSPALTWAISVVGVVVFCGLTAYDSQRLRAYAVENAGTLGDEGSKKVAIYGALSLYLDFINLFLMLLRLFGGRRD